MEAALESRVESGNGSKSGQLVGPIFAVGSTIDSLSTITNMSHGGQEMNPLVSALMERIGTAPGALRVL